MTYDATMSLGFASVIAKQDLSLKLKIRLDKNMVISVMRLLQHHVIHTVSSFLAVKQEVRQHVSQNQSS